MNFMAPMIESLHVRGFRSLADVELTNLTPAIILIGPNGSGKSNILQFLYLLHYMLGHRRLARWVERHGGASDQLFGGSDATDQIEAEITIKVAEMRYDYRFTLEYAYPEHLYFRKEAFRSRVGEGSKGKKWHDLGNGHREANLVLAAQSNEFSHLDKTEAATIVKILRQCTVFQFHNTDFRSSIRRGFPLRFHGRKLRFDGGNLAAVLYYMEREDRKRYEQICRYVQRILPGFDQFEIEKHEGKVALRWQSSWSDYGFGAHLTSDGSLRTFALVTLLNSTAETLPDVILLDEPELGLHPAAVTLIGNMIQSLATQKQVIVATQSPLLVDLFNLKQIRVLELRYGRTEIHEVDPAQYTHWLDDYSTGELWQRNLLGGPSVIRLAISVEGETEVDFVNIVLAPHLRGKGVEPIPILPHSRGGNIRVDRVASAMAELFWSFDHVTSLVDFYGFMDKDNDSPSQLEHRIDNAVGQRIHSSWDETRVFAYVQLHEFEALLFSDVHSFGIVFDGLPDGVLAKLLEVRAHFSSPEDINDNSTTAPSKRISQLVPGYNKRLHGPDPRCRNRLVRHPRRMQPIQQVVDPTGVAWQLVLFTSQRNVQQPS